MLLSSKKLQELGYIFCAFKVVTTEADIKKVVTELVAAKKEELL